MDAELFFATTVASGTRWAKEYPSGQEFAKDYAHGAGRLRRPRAVKSVVSELK